MDTFFTANGISICFNDHSNSNEIPIVFIHGFPFDKSMWAPQVAALPDNFRPITYDVRGHGQSGKPHEADKYSFRLLVEDIIAVLDELKIDRCHVYGHSMGGWFVYGLAIYYPSRLYSIIISDGAPSL